MSGKEASCVVMESSNVDERLDKPAACTSVTKKSPGKQARPDRTKSKTITKGSLATATKLHPIKFPEVIVTKCMEPIVETMSVLQIQSFDTSNGAGPSTIERCCFTDESQIFSSPDIAEGQSTSYTLVDISEIPTSDYDSCFETDPEVFSDTPPAVGCDMCESSGDGDDADSGVIESGSGQVSIGNDFVDMKEVLVESLDSEEAGRNEIEEARIMKMLESLDEKVDRGSLTKDAVELLKLIPDGYIPLPHQVGGHRHMDGKLGFMRKLGETDIVYKPVQYGIKGPREVQFYESLFRTKPSRLSNDMLRLKQLVPCYYGLDDIRDHSGDISPFMKLEDISSRFHKPCIMDIKVGKRVWDDYAHQDKIDREKKKYPPQEIIGFRIIGLRVYRHDTDDYVYFSKEFGRNVSVNSALEALREFFYDGRELRRDIINSLIDKLQQYHEWVEFQTTFKLFATSLLIVYEGDSMQPIRTQKDLLDVRLVDFAHAYERNSADNVGPDENFLFGLENFIKFLSDLKQ